VLDASDGRLVVEITVSDMPRLLILGGD